MTTQQLNSIQYSQTESVPTRALKGSSGDSFFLTEKYFTSISSMEFSGFSPSTFSSFIKKINPKITDAHLSAFFSGSSTPKTRATFSIYNYISDELIKFCERYKSRFMVDQGFIFSYSKDNISMDSLKKACSLYTNSLEFCKLFHIRISVMLGFPLEDIAKFWSISVSDVFCSSSPSSVSIKTGINFNETSKIIVKHAYELTNSKEEEYDDGEIPLSWFLQYIKEGD